MSMVLVLKSDLRCSIDQHQKLDKSIIKDVFTQWDMVSKKSISDNWQVYIVQNDSQSGSRIPDPI